MTTIASRRSVMVLFSNPSCAFSHRARIVLAEKDITVDVVDVDPENMPDDLLHINPYSSVPTLVDRDLVLYDSRVICEYLDERFPHPPLMPVDPVSRARTRLALYRIEKDWYELVPDLEAGSGKKFEEARKVLRESLTSSAEVFSIKPYFLSDEFSMVDATIAPILWRLSKYGIELSGKSGKEVNAYARRLFARKTFVQSLSEAELEMN